MMYGDKSKTDDETMDRSNFIPKRFIYSEEDLEHYLKSPAKKSLLGFVMALGQACVGNGDCEENDGSLPSYEYKPDAPLQGLTPGMASLHGSLRCMSETWVKDLPPDETGRARFGNPSFKAWHERIVKRSVIIVDSMLESHLTHHKNENDSFYTDDIIEQCSEKGYQAASTDTSDNATNNNTNDPKRLKIVVELSHYLQASFGHPVRLDYGTGHESSFLVFLLASLHAMMLMPDNKTLRLAPIALSMFTQYLHVTRGLQTKYMLEPAGSHGVWGLDDYHCLPFYFGACQLQQQQTHLLPSSIHDRYMLEELSSSKLYFGCIKYITDLKKGVPFFESSPMLNDISCLPSWEKVTNGLLKLYEGEVLKKLPVVQHFLFGALYPASWKPSQIGPKVAPKRTLPPSQHHGLVAGGNVVDTTIAPWANNSKKSIPDTRAPWKK